MIDSVEKTTIRKIYVRLLPLLFVAYFICYLDRINVGFAALTMNRTWASPPRSMRWGPPRSSGAIACSRCRATSFSKKLARGDGSPAS